MKRYWIIVILFVVALTIYGLDRGIYIGSVSYYLQPDKPRSPGEVIIKHCRYLFVTGISEIPAHGGVFDQSPLTAGMQPENNAHQLYCRFFGE